MLILGLVPVGIRPVMLNVKLNPVRMTLVVLSLGVVKTVNCICHR